MLSMDPHGRGSDSEQSAKRWTMNHGFIIVALDDPSRADCWRVSVLGKGKVEVNQTGPNLGGQGWQGSMVSAGRNRTG